MTRLLLWKPLLLLMPSPLGCLAPVAPAPAPVCARANVTDQDLGFCSPWARQALMSAAERGTSPAGAEAQDAGPSDPSASALFALDHAAFFPPVSRWDERQGESLRGRGEEPSTRADGGGGENRPRNLRLQAEGDWGSFSSQLTLPDAASAKADPFAGQKWKTEEACRFHLHGPFSLFGQVGAVTDGAAGQELKVNTRAGVACKLPPVLGAEVQLRGGQALTYTDLLRPERVGEKAEFFLEMQYRFPGNVGLEYQGALSPALDPAARDQITQDLRLVLPVGQAAKLRLGAKHRLDGVPAARPWTDNTQFYLGFELGGGRAN